MPEDTKEFSINASNARFWEPPVKRHIDEVLADRAGVAEAEPRAELRSPSLG